MPVHGFASQRLFIDTKMAEATQIACARQQHNHLCNVLHLKAGDEILVFNGRDGEWRARLTGVSKQACELDLIERTRTQTPSSNINYLFAPLKSARLDDMVQKAVELGVASLKPVMTVRTIASSVNLEHIGASVIKAAQQCAILSIPKVCKPETLKQTLANWPAGHPLIFADESAQTKNPLHVLKAMQPGPTSVLIGPEGGFCPSERDALLAKSYVIPISLGPRVMRADTAAVAALALVNATVGDWR